MTISFIQSILETQGTSPEEEGSKETGTKGWLNYMHKRSIVNQEYSQVYHYRTFDENGALSAIASISKSNKNKKEDFPEGKSSKVKWCA